MDKKVKLLVILVINLIVSVVFFQDSRNIVTKINYTNSNNLENVIEVGEVKNGAFDVIIKNINKSVSNISVPVWSNKNGQDDIYWYSAHKQADGSFKTTIYLKNHKYDSGDYSIHVYLYNNKNQFIDFTNYTKNVFVNSINGILSFDNINEKNEQIRVSLSNTDYYYDTITFAIWSAENGQDDVKWYTSSKLNDSAIYTMQLKNHKSYGLYWVDAYAFDSNGKGTFLNRGSFTIELPKVIDSSFNYDATTNDIDIMIKFDSNINITTMQIPIWSALNGQDDIIWHNATNKGEGIWELHTNLSSHHYSVGDYNAHVYVGNSLGMYTCVHTFTKEFIPIDRLSSSIDSTESNFTINYKDYSKFKGYDIHYAVWSDTNGQDDIRWYDATNGSYTGSFSNHLNERGIADSGLYHVHLYISKNGIWYLIDTGSFTVSNPKVNTIEMIQHGSLVDVYIKNTSNNVTSVQVPFWSNKNGQDDIIWYTATKNNGVWKVTIDLKNHNYDMGDYTAHAYIKSGNKLKVIGSHINIFLNKGTISATPDNTNQNVELKLLNTDFSNVKFVVWSVSGGQDDLVSYKTSVSNNVAIYNLPIKNHRTAGLYKVEAYFGNLLLATAEFTIDDINFNADILNVDTTDEAGDGIYQVKVSDINSKSGISKIEIAVWTTDNQNDIWWYKAEKQGNDYIVNVNPKNHKYNSGNYHTHIYMTANNGICKFMAKENVQVKLKVSARLISNYKGTYKFLIYNTSPKVTRVQFPTWSLSGGQDDIVWYESTKQSDGSWLAIVKSFDHDPYGITTSHIYATAGSETLFSFISYNIEKYMLTPVYYSQRDERWRTVFFGRWNMGNTGCMPSSIAMAISGINDYSVSPYDVANYLYYSTNSFNKYYLGTGGNAVRQAAIKYEVNYNILPTFNSLEKALKNGKIVIGAVRYGDFVKNPNATHAIVLYGYDNGNTNVYDPYDSNKNGKYSIERIYSQQSFVSEDLESGGAFHALY